MEEDVEADPSFRNADAFRGIAEDLFRRTQAALRGVRLVAVDGKLADPRRALDISFGDIVDVDIFEFRHGTLEETSHDGFLGKQTLGMLIVDGILEGTRLIFRHRASSLRPPIRTRPRRLTGISKQALGFLLLL